jgi:RND family efflux transporter MFP subunit
VLAERGQVVAAGTPVLQVAQDGPRDAVFAVPEDKLADFKPGDKALVRVWSSGATSTGVVREVAASADPVTRTFSVKLGLAVSDNLPLGSTVTVLPATATHTAAQMIKIPTNALRQDGQGSAVWLLDATSMTVKLQPVQVAGADGNDVVIVAGLTPGMQVVTAGVHVLSAGQKVSVYKEKMAPALTSKAQTAITSGVSVTAAAVASAASAK